MSNSDPELRTTETVAPENGNGYLAVNDPKLPSVQVFLGPEEHPLLRLAEATLELSPRRQAGAWTVTDRIMKRTLRVAAEELRAELTKKAALRFQIEQINLTIASAAQEITVALDYFGPQDVSK